MGDVADTVLSLGWSAERRAELMLLAPQLTERQASDVVEFADATGVGMRRGWIRLGIGAAAGIVAALVVGYVVRGRL
jgi:hypothetical protein